MAVDKSGGGEQPRRHPRRLIFAPGDIAAFAAETNNASHPLLTAPHHHLPLLHDDQFQSGASTPSANASVIAHAARARQFLSNPPLSFSQLSPTNPFRQFHSWFRDPRLFPSSAPETCTLATASMPSGRVSARIMYLKELDERGWVVYSNWGSKAGKGTQVFGMDAVDFEVCPGTADASIIEDKAEGNRWAALTFYWPTVERQVRVEGLVEPLPKGASETYWRTRERASQIGAWASQQSKVLWSTVPEPQQDEGVLSNIPGSTEHMNRAESSDEDEDDDGRSVLENRVLEIEARFAGTEEIPLPPFWGGVRIVPESVEFWQGRKGRLHDRFRYVRIHDGRRDEDQDEKRFRWRIWRLSP